MTKIVKTVKKSLKDIKRQKLTAEYEEASAEILRINQELEGAISDGID